MTIIFLVPLLIRFIYRVWSEWRDKSGKLMRTDYRNYLDRLNEAAKLNSKERI